MLAFLAVATASSVHDAVHASVARNVALSRTVHAAASNSKRAAPVLRNPDVPQIPGKYVASVHLTQIGTVPFADLGVNSVWAVDDDKQRMIQRSTDMFPFAPFEYIGTPLEWVNITQFLTSNYFGIDFNGIKLSGQVYHNTYGNMFAWLPAANYSGKMAFNGSAYDTWTYVSADADTKLRLLVTDKGLPVRLEQNVTTPDYKTIYEFKSFVPDATDLDYMWATFNTTQFSAPEPCPVSEVPKPINMSMYIFHPANNFNITGQDLGDATGDVMFTCGDLLTNLSSSVDHDYEWITLWRMELVPRWGQYLNCNDYPPTCLGAEDFWVGKEAPDALGMPEGGQCTDNTLTGEWYSLPPGGKCSGTGTPGDGSCTWRAFRVKTIDANCLFKSNGFIDACVEGKRAPFTQATGIFTQALESDDPSQGGCPPLNVGPVAVA